MPKISEKGIDMPLSPIRKLVPFAEAAKRKGRKVYHLNIGQPDIVTPQVAVNAVKNVMDSVISYGHSAGNESFRRKLVDYYAGNGIEVDYEDILITGGSSEAIPFSFMSCFNPGDEVIIPEPFYANYQSYAFQSSVNVKPVTSTIETDFALPPISAFERLITPKTKGIFLCNPNNPTGTLYSKEDLEQLARIVKQYDLYLFSDEVYREFCYDGQTHFSALNLKGIEQNVVMIDSVSKRYSLCGARVGAMVSRNKELIAAVLKFGQARLCPPFYGQVAAEAALDVDSGYFQQVHQEYLKRRNVMVNGLNAIPGVLCPMPKGSFYSLVQFPVDDCDRFAQWLLEEFEYKNQTVMIAPASGFYATLGLGRNQARLAYVLKTDDLEAALECLRIALEQYPGRTN